MVTKACCVLFINYRRAAKDCSKSIGSDGITLKCPMCKVFGSGVSPGHILPIRAIRIALEVEMPHSILIEHAVGVVHPAPKWGVMIDRTIFLAVGSVEIIACF